MRAKTIGLVSGLALMGLALSTATAQTASPLDLPSSPTDMFRSSTGTTPELGSSSLDELNAFEASLFSNRSGSEAPAAAPAPPTPTPPSRSTGKKTLQDWLRESPSGRASTTPAVPAPRPRVGTAPSRPPAATALSTAASPRVEPAVVPAPSRPAPTPVATRATKAPAPRKEAAPRAGKGRRRRDAKKKRPEKKAPAAVRLFAELRHLVELEFDRKKILSTGQGRGDLLALDNEVTRVRQRILELKEEKRREEAEARASLLAPSEEKRDRRDDRRDRRRPPMESSPMGSPLSRRSFH